MDATPDPSSVCPVCGYATDPFRCKLICPRCHNVVESCADGGEVPGGRPKAAWTTADVADRSGGGTA